MVKNNFRIDEIDIKILKELYDTDSSCTSTELTKKIFKDIENHRDLSSKNSNIIHRMEKLSKYGLMIYLKKDGKNIYSVNPERVICGLGKMKVKTKDDENMSFKFPNLVMIKPNGFWISHQIS